MARDHDAPIIGVLDLQGDVREHVRALADLGAEVRRVKTAADLDDLDGLVIPGGESTTIGRLLAWHGMLEPIRERAEARRLAIYGTCAGMILLAREIEGSDQPRIGVLDAAVARNAYGRQVDSFEVDIPVPALGPEPLPAVFIRAPVVRRVWGRARVLATLDGAPVLVEQDHLLASSFHPELTEDRRVHRYFVERVVPRIQRPGGGTGHS